MAIDMIELDEMVNGVARPLPMKTRNFGGKATERGGDGIELDLSDLGLGFGVRGIFVHHVI